MILLHKPSSSCGQLQPPPLTVFSFPKSGHQASQPLRLKNQIGMATENTISSRAKG